MCIRKQKHHRTKWLCNPEHWSLIRMFMCSRTAMTIRGATIASALFVNAPLRHKCFLGQPLIGKRSVHVVKYK